MLRSNDILQLPWEDVICKRILQYLTIKEVHRLKCVSKNFKTIIELYMDFYCQALDFSIVAHKKNFNENIFLQIVNDKSNIRQLDCKNCKSWLKDEHIVPLLRNNSGLNYLSVTDCYGLTHQTFECISQYSHNLKWLDFSLCRDLSAESLKMIASNLHRLEGLNVSGCWQLNDDCIEEIAVNNPELKKLRLMLCYSLTDKSINTIAKSCINLVCLDIRGCWRVKDSSIITIREYSKCLKSLLVKDCTNISEISLARMRVRGVIIDVPMPGHTGSNRFLSNPMPLLQI